MGYIAAVPINYTEIQFPIETWCVANDRQQKTKIPPMIEKLKYNKLLMHLCSLLCATQTTKNEPNGQIEKDLCFVSLR